MGITSVSASVFTTDKLVYVRAEDYYHAFMPSIKGLHAYTAEPASLDWIGSVLRQALQSASFTDLTPEQWDQAHFDESRQKSKMRFEQELKVIAKQFHLRNKESVLSQALKVWIFWKDGRGSNDTQILATNHRRGGYLPWQDEPKYNDKRMELRLESSSDVEIGEAVRRMQAQCLLNGKRPMTV